MEEQITNGDRTSLLAMLRSDGFRVLQKIMKAKCDAYITILLNSNPADAEEVLAAHRMAKAAAQFYESVTSEINQEILMFNADNMYQKPQDVTEGMLDIDNSQHEQFEEEQF